MDKCWKNETNSNKTSSILTYAWNVSADDAIKFNLFSVVTMICSGGAVMERSASGHVYKHKIASRELLTVFFSNIA